MDGRRFDNLARLAATTSRRRLFQTLLGAAGGGVLALAGVRRAGAASCLPGGPDCEGCCIAGYCFLGLTEAACGSGGERCIRCESYQECVERQCLPKCRPETCPGCCVGSSICLLGLTESACGTGGARCRRCPAGTRCVDGACVTDDGNGEDDTEPPGTPPPDDEPGDDDGETVDEGDEQASSESESANCNRDTCLNGCCRNGACVSPPTDADCGLGGELCITCAAPQVCRSGFCQDPCGPDNCAGCCDQFSGCRPGTSALSCGKDGARCVPCLSGICRDGACLPCDESSCPDGCCDDLGICRTPATAEYCGRRGGTCVACADGETCVNGRCVREVGNVPASQTGSRIPDYGYASVRPSDWTTPQNGNGAAGAVLDDGASFNYQDLSPAQRDQFFDATLRSSFPADRMTTGYLGFIGIPSQNGAATGWDQIVNTRWQSFDAAANEVVNEIFPTFVSTYLAGTTPLASDRTIGDASLCHAWQSLTKTGSPQSSLLCVAALDNSIVQVRHDSYAGAPPDQGQSESWLDALVTRGREAMASGYSNLGTYMPYLQADGSVRYSGYTAYDGTVFHLNTQGASAFATRQERLTGIDRAFTSTERITNQNRWGDYSGFSGGSFEQFGNNSFADTYFQMLSEYEAQDAAQQGISYNNWTEIPISTVPARGLQIRRPTDQGWIPVVQIDLRTGSLVTKFSAVGAIPIPADRDATPEYWGAVGDLTTAIAGEFLASQGQAEDALSVEEALRTYTGLHDGCFSSSPEQCVTGGPLVTTEEGSTEASTEEGELPPIVDFPAAVLLPTDIAAAYGIDLTEAEAAAGVTFYSEEGAADSGLPAELLAAIPWTRTAAGHAYGWRYLSPDAPSGSLGTIYTTALFQGGGGLDARAICHGITDTFLGGVPERTNQLNYGLETHTYTFSGTTGTGQAFSTQIGIVREGSLVTFVRMDDFTGEEPGLPVFSELPDTGEIVETEHGIMRLLFDRSVDTQRADPNELKLPNYTGILTSSFFTDAQWSDRAFVYESNVAVDGQAIRPFGQPLDQFARYQDRFASVTRGSYRTDLLTFAGDPETPLILTRQEYAFGDPADAAEFLGTLPTLVEESGGESAIEKEYDAEPEGLPEGSQAVYYVRTDETGRLIGQETWLPLPETASVLIVDAVAPRRFDPDAEVDFADIDPLAGASRVFAHDYLLTNKLLGDQTEGDREVMFEDLNDDWRNFRDRYD